MQGGLANVVSITALAFVPQALRSQTLEIAPVTIELPAGRQTATIRMVNRGTEPTTVQIRSFAWSQRGDEEVLNPTADLLVSPPFATLAPGDAQTVRLVLRKRAALKEDSYRLLVDQLPPAAAPGSVRVALRISLPVFAQPVGPVRSALTWKLVAASKARASLVVRNDGSRRARISDLAITGSGATIRAMGFTFRYLLPGTQASIPLIVEPAAGSRPPTFHVSASSDQGKVEADAPYQPVP